MSGSGGGQSRLGQSAEEGAVVAATAARNPTPSGQVGKQECSRPRISSRSRPSLERVSPVCFLFLFSCLPSPIPAPSPFNSPCLLSPFPFQAAFSLLFAVSYPDFPPFSFFSFSLVLLLPFSFPGQSHRKAIFHRSRESKRLLSTQIKVLLCPDMPVSTGRAQPLARLSDVLQQAVINN